MTKPVICGFNLCTHITNLSQQLFSVVEEHGKPFFPSVVSQCAHWFLTGGQEKPSTSPTCQEGLCPLVPVQQESAAELSAQVPWILLSDSEASMEYGHQIDKMSHK